MSCKICGGDCGQCGGPILDDTDQTSKAADPLVPFDDGKEKSSARSIAGRLRSLRKKAAKSIHE